MTRRYAILRIDNIHSSDDIEPGCMGRLSQLMEVINQYNIPVLLGVTPHFGRLYSDQTSPPIREGFDYVKELLSEGHGIALHGVTHRCRVLPEDKHSIERSVPSCHEYRCRDYEERYGRPIPIDLQSEWLAEGNTLLGSLVGQETDVLMPPAHYYGPTTLEAMRRTGFRYIANYDRQKNRPHQENGIWVIGAHLEDYPRLASLSNTNAAVEIFRYFLGTSGDFIQLFLHTRYGADRIPNSSLDMIDIMLRDLNAEGREFILPLYIPNKVD
ncbi:MAG: DUF2334 domain-containing protein [Candidatus Aenigmarchaeota archaeon]|nr:DUF2334 domain-containing protein [Candidatus Aenigmarchaeota archaeon]